VHCRLVRTVAMQCVRVILLVFLVWCAVSALQMVCAGRGYVFGVVVICSASPEEAGGGVSRTWRLLTHCVG
jgi:hypothetical protein